MEEIKLYYDEGRKNEIQGDIVFEKVNAGENSIREIFVFNDLNFKVNMVISIEGEDIKINQEIKDLIPKQIKKIEFKLSPRLTTMKPITAKLKIKLEYELR